MSNQIFVGRLPVDCRTRELEDFFSKYGRLTRCDVKRGFAFVEFEDPRDAEDAVKYCDGARFLGGNINVEWAKGTRRGTNPDGTRSDECFKCGKAGHFARDCPMIGGTGVSSSRRDYNERFEGRGRRDAYDDRDRDRSRSRSRDRDNRRNDYGRSDRGRYDRERYDRERDTRRRSRSRSRSRSPAPRAVIRSRSPVRSPMRSPVRSPARSPMRSPVRERSVSRSPIRSPSPARSVRED